MRGISISLVLVTTFLVNMFVPQWNVCRLNSGNSYASAKASPQNEQHVEIKKRIRSYRQLSRDFSNPDPEHRVNPEFGITFNAMQTFDAGARFVDSHAPIPRFYRDTPDLLQLHARLNI